MHLFLKSVSQNERQNETVFTLIYYNLTDVNPQLSENLKILLVKLSDKEFSSGQGLTMKHPHKALADIYENMHMSNMFTKSVHKCSPTLHYCCFGLK